MCVHTYHMHNDCVMTITIQQSTSPVELLIVCWGLFGGGGGGGLELSLSIFPMQGLVDTNTTRHVNM